MTRFVCFILMLLFIFPLIVACQSSNTDESSFSDEPSSDYDFTAKIGSKTFEINRINCSPISDEAVIYTRDYRINGKYSPVVGGDVQNRTVVSVRVAKNDDGYEFDVVARTEDTENGVIPYNGFALSIPTEQLEGVRLNVGQLIAFDGFERLSLEIERTDLATIAPDYLISSATRRVGLTDPIYGFENDKIYRITDKFQGADITVDNVTVTAKITTNYSCEILSIEKKNRIKAAKKGEVMFVFTGEYNVSFAEYYFKDNKMITYSNIDKCNSYSDKSAILIKNDVVELNDENLNIPVIEADGIYVFDSDFSSLVTPVINKKRVDIVIIEDYIAVIGNENERTLIPEGNGFVISFVGDKVIAEVGSLKVGEKIKTCYIDYFTLPDKYVEVNGKYFGYDFRDGVRAPEGVSVVYTPDYGETTGSNIYGSEIVVADGKVISVNIGKGDSRIPKNGFVLSVHKDSEWYKSIKNVKVGDTATLGYGGGVYDIKVLKINGINSVRNENTLILYKDKPSTQTNPYGYEIAINENGIAVSDGYNGNMTIPKDGFVLSGHGVNKTALEEAFAIGQDVVFDAKNYTVALIKTPEQRLENAKHDFTLVSDKLDSAKKAFLNLDYNGISEQFALMDNVIDEAEAAFDSYDFETALAKAESVISTCEKLQYSFYESNGVENRAVWYRSTEKSDDEVRATVQKLKELNINSLYLETWYEGFCIGSKVDVEGIAKHPNNGTYDALEGFIRIGHEYGIEVHAWVHNFFVGYFYKEGNRYYNPTFDEYKDKYLIDIKGREHFYYSANDNYFIFLNPFDRECRDLILNVYEQLITNYELDGLHLDYVRMPELNYGTDDFGYNEDIIDAFAKETGITKAPATFVKNSAEHQKWVEFRCNIITGFVGEVYDMVRKKTPDLWLSAATYPDLNMAKNDIFQDVRSIINKGYLDEVFSMSYGVDNNSVTPSVKSYNSITEDKIFYSAGIAAFLETTDKNFASQLDEVVNKGADGVSIFSLSSITPGSYYKPITEGAFRAPAVQINKLSLTASAQMEYIKAKADNLSAFYQTLNAEDIDYIKSQCEDIIKFSNDFDVNNSTVSQKIDWCNKAMTKLASAKTNVLSKCGENNETDSIISEFELLEYWLKISALRLNTRK